MATLGESKLKAEKIAALAEKQVKIIDEANQALANGEFQWAMELADVLLAINPDDSEAKNIKAAAADHFALIQTASNDYYFYKTIAGELRGEIDVVKKKIFLFRGLTRGQKRGIKWMFFFFTLFSFSGNT